MANPHAKLVSCNVPTKNSAAAQKFYNTLLGAQNFGRSATSHVESHFRPIGSGNLHLTITTRQDEREPITCYFSVDNLDDTISQLTAAGGKVVVNPTPMPASGPGKQSSEGLGRFATMLDPDGNAFGLIQLDKSGKTLLNA